MPEYLGDYERNGRSLDDTKIYVMAQSIISSLITVTSNPLVEYQLPKTKHIIKGQKRFWKEHPVITSLFNRT